MTFTTGFDHGLDYMQEQDAKGKGTGGFSNIPSSPCLVTQELWKRVKVRGLCIHLLWSPAPTWASFDPKLLQAFLSLG